ncbi:unnamed protein product [Lactuca saligna]|uniref:Uncharacterized protein n=1 Tax=Lactuca saligna TaxID=75948 RepID=A0AA36EI42_LACSI|nr:unnamed protein product [Lactuca saligna]
MSESSRRRKSKESKTTKKTKLRYVEHEHEQLEDENDLEVGVEFRVHDPTIKWNQMKPTVVLVDELGVEGRRGLVVISDQQKGVDVNEIENYLEAEWDVIHDLVPLVQREVAIQDLDANAWVSEDYEETNGENDFIEDTQVVGSPRKMKIYEKIVKIKMKKAVYDKDGRGSSIKKPVNLE